MVTFSQPNNPQQPPTDVFWGEISPCQHIVQIYQGEGVFLDTLEGFAAGGLERGEGVIIIASAAHRGALERRLRHRKIDISAARARDQYIALDAEQTLSRFMINGWPDDQLFEEVLTGLIDRAQHDGRRVRAFGEMVALLWSQGCSGATVRLEHLWHRFCQEKAFSLFCAYPRIGFTQDAESSIQEICAAHDRVIAG